MQQIKSTPRFLLETKPLLMFVCGHLALQSLDLSLHYGVHTTPNVFL